MKGLLLAGGNGTRMWPTTQVISKHLIPCFDKPTIYYPLSTLIELGVDDLCIVCKSTDIDQFAKLLRNLLDSLHIKLSGAFQDEPLGLAHAIIRADWWIGHDPFWMILGDNIFTQTPTIPTAPTPAIGFTSHLDDPRDFGVVETDDQYRIVRIEEKPKESFSNRALTGLYRFDHSAVSRAKALKPSGRGELEIADLFQSYIDDSTAKAWPILGQWFDTGMPEAMFEASAKVQDLQHSVRQPIGSPEIAALRAGRISHRKFVALVESMPNGHYRRLLSRTFA